MASISSIPAQLRVPQTADTVYGQARSPLFQSKTSQGQSPGNKNSQNLSTDDPSRTNATALQNSETLTAQARAANLKQAQALGLAPKPAAAPTPPPRPTTDTVQLSEPAQAEALHQLGFTVSEIANRLGTSATAIDGYLKIPATEPATQTQAQSKAAATSRA